LLKEGEVRKQKGINYGEAVRFEKGTELLLPKYYTKTTGSAPEPVVWDYLQMTIDKCSQLRLGQSAYFLSSHSAVLK
jgi:hypothetical protein